MNTFQQLYPALSARILGSADRFTAQGLIPVATVALYAGQPESDAPITLPALFVGYTEAWETGNAHSRQGIVTVELHLLAAPDVTEAQALGYPALVADLLEGIGGLSLVGDEPGKGSRPYYRLLRMTAPVFRERGSALTPAPGIAPQVAVE